MASDQPILSHENGIELENANPAKLETEGIQARQHCFTGLGTAVGANHGELNLYAYGVCQLPWTTVEHRIFESLDIEFEAASFTANGESRHFQAETLALSRALA